MVELVHHNFKRYIANILQAIKNPQGLFPKALEIRGIGITIRSSTQQRYDIGSPWITQLLEELFEKAVEFLARLQASRIV